jgi:Domain of unknown function (DUF3943)
LPGRDRFLWSAALTVIACTPTTGWAQQFPNEDGAGKPATTIHALPAAATAYSEPRQSWLVPSLHALGLMTVMRGTETFLWPEPFAQTQDFGYHYRQAFTRPPLWDGSRAAFEWDGDRWQLNVIGHGLFGSELYLRARACRNSPAAALLFTGAASTVWEYGFEANGVRPSALDLVYTPVMGLALGELRFQLMRLTRHWAPSTGRSMLRYGVDPLGELERLLGAPC